MENDFSYSVSIFLLATIVQFYVPYYNWRINFLLILLPSENPVEIMIGLGGKTDKRPWLTHPELLILPAYSFSESSGTNLLSK